MTAYLHHIATQVPEYSYDQDFALKTILKLVGDTDAKRNFLTRVYQGSGIRKRHSVIGDYQKSPAEHTFYPPNENLKPEPGTKARNDLFIPESERLTALACDKLFLEQPRLKPSSVTHLITVSCTGFGAPGFDFHLLKHLGLPGSTERYHIGFMGCFGAFPALRLAAHIIASAPHAKVLVVNCEICSVHFQLGFDPEIQVANAIFADGASAAYLSGNPADGQGTSFAIRHFASEVIPESVSEMSWKIGEHGFDMRLSSYVPRLIEGNIRPIIETLLARSEWDLDSIDHWAIHPGGRAILDKVSSVLGLKPEALKPSYETLRDFGNMSSTTVMFVLNHIMRAGKRGKLFASAFGPGLTVESASMERV
ncbi:MAG: type III polyketide synthase [Spirochaetia bacterium]|nr:type III polyketide synthase [Spirochaetia bacterium]